MKLITLKGFVRGNTLYSTIGVFPVRNFYGWPEGKVGYYLYNRSTSAILRAFIQNRFLITDTEESSASPL